MTPTISDRKIEANRQNATLSTGPTSAEGKAVSSRNAFSHGLTASEPLLPGEDPAEFAEYLEAYRRTYRPSGFQAEELVAELASIRWRLRRVPSFEAQLLQLEIHSLLQSGDDQAKDLGQSQLLALAFMRLCERKVLQNLQQQEARLSSRAEKLQRALLDMHAAAPTPRVPSRTPDPRPVPTVAPAAPVTAPVRKIEPIRVAHAPGRNDACSCGSGLKFKRCCLNRPQLLSQAA